MIEGVPPSPPVPDAGDVDRPAKPCARRLKTPDGKQTWCALPAEHRDPTSPDYTPDCAGITPRELPANDLGPGRVPRWGK